MYRVTFLAPRGGATPTFALQLLGKRNRFRLLRLQVGKDSNLLRATDHIRLSMDCFTRFTRPGRVSTNYTFLSIPQ